MNIPTKIETRLESSSTTYRVVLLLSKRVSIFDGYFFEFCKLGSHHFQFYLNCASKQSIDLVA